MSDYQLKTPVAFFIFNRPDTTEKVFEEIRRAKPPILFVIGDGPRAGRPNEDTKCKEARAIIDTVDWPCEVYRNYSEINLGCWQRVSSGIDWVFRFAEEAIILEDDCLPNSSFFRFCQELLENYRHEPQVAQIGGANFQFGRDRSSTSSYYFSRYSHVWGWATWRRAWIMNDKKMQSWPGFRDGNGLGKILSGNREVAYWTDVLDKVYEAKIDSWACRWTLSCWQHNALTILPRVNLVSNIGFGPAATHTRYRNKFAEVPAHPISFPLQHPIEIAADRNADDYTGRTMFTYPSFCRRVLNALRWLLR